MSSSDLASAIYAGNDVAMQWYMLAHPQQFPASGVVTMDSTAGGGRLAIGSGALWVIGLGVLGVAWLVTRR